MGSFWSSGITSPIRSRENMAHIFARKQRTSLRNSVIRSWSPDDAWISILSLHLHLFLLHLHNNRIIKSMSSINRMSHGCFGVDGVLNTRVAWCVRQGISGMGCVGEKSRYSIRRELVIHDLTVYLDFSAKIKRNITSQAWNWIGIRTPGSDVRVFLYWLMACVYLIVWITSVITEDFRAWLKSQSWLMATTWRPISWSLCLRLRPNGSDQSRGTPPDCWSGSARGSGDPFSGRAASPSNQEWPWHL